MRAEEAFNETKPWLNDTAEQPTLVYDTEFSCPSCLRGDAKPSVLRLLPYSERGLRAYHKVPEPHNC